MKPGTKLKKRDIEDGTRFVRLVKDHPCLYNYNCEDYTRREKVEAAWIDIGNELKQDPMKLKEKWRNYRTVFLRRCKAEQNGCPIRTNYYLTKEMSFLLPYIRVSVPLNEYAEGGSSGADKSTTNQSKVFTIVVPKEGKDEMEFQEEDNNYEEDFGESTTTTYIATAPQNTSNNGSNHDTEYVEVKQEPFVSRQSAAIMEETNPRKLFIYSILPDIDRMTDRQFRKYRKLTLNFLDTCEDEEDKAAE